MAAEAEVASLFAKLGVKVDKRSFGEGKQGLDDLTKAAYGTEHASEQAQKQVQRLAATASDAAGKGIKLLAAGLAGAAVAAVGLVTRVAAAGAAVDDMAKRTGASVRDLQRLTFAAGQSGTSMETVEASIRKLSNAIVDARNASSPAAKAFRQLGLDAGALAKMGVEDRLGVVGDALAKVTADTDRTALSMDLLGKGGTELAGLLEGGAAGLREMGDEAERLGVVLSDEAIANSAKLDDTLAALEAQVGGVLGTIASGLMPVVQEIAGDVMEWASANREMIATKVEAFLRDVLPLLRDFAKVALDLVGIVVDLSEALGGGEEAIIALGAAYAGLKITTWAGALTSANTAWASLIGTWAGGITTAAALGFAIGTALDKALGLSDALAGVNQHKGGRGVAMLGDLTDDEQRRLNDAVERRNVANEAASSSLTPWTIQQQAARDAEAAQREIDAIQGQGRARANARKRAVDSSRAVDNAARAATAAQQQEQRNALMRQQEASQARAGLGQLSAFGSRALSGVSGLVGSIGETGPTRTTRRGGGGRGRAAPKPEESIADMLERDFAGGKGGSLRDAAGGGASAIAGASFVRIDASYNAPTTVNVILPRGSLGRSDVERGQAIGDGAGRALEKRNRDAAEHYHEAVRP